MNHLQKLAQALIPLNKHTWNNCINFGREFELKMAKQLSNEQYSILYINFTDNPTLSINRDNLRGNWTAFSLKNGCLTQRFGTKGVSKQEVAKRKKALIKALQKLDIETAQQLADNCQLNQAA